MVNCKECRYAVSVAIDSPTERWVTLQGEFLANPAPLVVCECHLHPPVARRYSTIDYIGWATFPIVHPDNWCADGEPPR